MSVSEPLVVFEKWSQLRPKGSCLTTHCESDLLAVFEKVGKLIARTSRPTTHLENQSLAVSKKPIQLTATDFELTTNGENRTLAVPESESLAEFETLSRRTDSRSDYQILSNFVLSNIVQLFSITERLDIALNNTNGEHKVQNYEIQH